PRRVPQPAAAALERGGDPARDRSPARGADGLSAPAGRGPRLASAMLIGLSVLAFRTVLLMVALASTLFGLDYATGRALSILGYVAAVAAAYGFLREVTVPRPLALGGI